MKIVWKVAGWVVRLAVLAAGVVVACEAVDRVREMERTKYLVDEDFDD